MSLTRNVFRRLHYPIDIIVQCVPWYLAYSLSLRNQKEMMAERGIVVDHSILRRWVIRLVPLLDKVFCKAIHHHGEPERAAIDKSGANSAVLAMLNADKLDEETINLRQSNYLNNNVEQDHCNIKRRIRHILRFSSSRREKTILAGIELIQKGNTEPAK
ncbi:hypothetical protein B4914_14170 [Yersinia entomophaga]|nr:hypothetical protein B4914_14170 [Yersinia entomophaga]